MKKSSVELPTESPDDEIESDLENERNAKRKRMRH